MILSHEFSTWIVQSRTYKIKHTSTICLQFVLYNAEMTRNKTIATRNISSKISCKLFMHITQHRVCKNRRNKWIWEENISKTLQLLKHDESHVWLKLTNAFHSCLKNQKTAKVLKMCRYAAQIKMHIRASLISPDVSHFFHLLSIPTVITAFARLASIHNYMKS